MRQLQRVSEIRTPSNCELKQTLPPIAASVKHFHLAPGKETQAPPQTQTQTVYSASAFQSATAEAGVKDLGQLARASGRETG